MQDWRVGMKWGSNQTDENWTRRQFDWSRLIAKDICQLTTIWTVQQRLSISGLTQMMMVGAKLVRWKRLCWVVAIVWSVHQMITKTTDKYRKAVTV